MSRNAAVKDVQIMLRREEYARGMEQRSSQRNAAAKDVQISASKEECASSMEQRLNVAAVKDVLR